MKAIYEILINFENIIERFFHQVVYRKYQSTLIQNAACIIHSDNKNIFKIMCINDASKGMQ